jgi:hypothetical protein
MEYFGYLRRNPDDAPDGTSTATTSGSQTESVQPAGEDMRDDTQAFNRAQRAEMVRAFIESIEYRERFFGAASGNQSAPPEEGQVARFVKAVVRFTLFGNASG